MVALIAAGVFAIGVWKYVLSLGEEPQEPAHAAMLSDSSEVTNADPRVAPSDTFVLRRDSVVRPADAAPVSPPPGKRQPKPAAGDTLVKRAVDSLSMPAMANMMNRVGGRAGQHRWLRANGDSSPTPSTAAASTATETREIMGHISRARRAFEAGQLVRALPEIRTAYEEYLVFAADHPDARETVVLGNQFRTLSERGLATCSAMRDSAVAKGGQGPPCEMLQAAMAANMPPVRPPNRADPTRPPPRPR